MTVAATRDVGTPDVVCARALDKRLAAVEQRLAAIVSRLDVLPVLERQLADLRDALDVLPDSVAARTGAPEPLVKQQAAARAVGVDARQLRAHKSALKRSGACVEIAPGIERWNLAKLRAGLPSEESACSGSERSEPAKTPATPRRTRKRRPIEHDPHCQLLPVGRVQADGERR